MVSAAVAAMKPAIFLVLFIFFSSGTEPTDAYYRNRAANSFAEADSTKSKFIRHMHGSTKIQRERENMKKISKWISAAAVVALSGTMAFAAIDNDGGKAW